MINGSVSEEIITFVLGEDTVEYMSLFTADGFEGTPIDCNEGALEWVPKADVLQLPIWQGDKLFFQLLNDNAPFFHLELYYDGDTLTRAVLDSTELPL